MSRADSKGVWGVVEHEPSFRCQNLHLQILAPGRFPDLRSEMGGQMATEWDSHLAKLQRLHAAASSGCLIHLQQALEERRRWDSTTSAPGGV